MSSSDSHGGDGSSTATTQRPPSSAGNGSHGSTPNRHRLSLEEDYFYQQLMTAEPRPPTEQPPPYTPYKPRPRQRGASGAVDGGGGSRLLVEQLPAYSTDIDIEGVWEMKMELSDAVRRADDRQWRTAMVHLRGTSLAFYAVNKEWGWGMAREWASNPDPDNPPWAKKATILRSYNLQHADVGIAADYKKRRNVIRLRLEADQLLLSCVEPATFVRWLDALFAALAIAHPIEERDFPVDQSVPRSQRSRLQRAQAQTALPRQRYLVPTPRPLDQLRLNGSSTSNLGGMEASAGIFGASSEVIGGMDWSRRPYAPSVTSSLRSLSHDVDIDADPWPMPVTQSPGPGQSATALHLMRSSSSSSPTSTSATTPSSSLSRAPSLRPVNRRSTTTSTSHRPPTSAATPPSEISRPGTSGAGMPASPTMASEDGKWRPTYENRPPGDDLRYGRLCYAILLFGSPHKSDYVIKRQTKWFVDWESGRMTRALPPAYKDIGLAEYDRMALRAKQALHPVASMMVAN